MSPASWRPARPRWTRGEAPVGMAPGAHLISVKVLDGTGTGKASAVIAAIDWVIAKRAQFGIRIINLSLGMAPTQWWRDDPVCQAVERAVRAGLVVVASAGNYGQTEDGKMVFGAVTSPGISPFAITVGALRTGGTLDVAQHYVAPWSSKGPTPDRADQAGHRGAGQQDRVAVVAWLHAGEAVPRAQRDGQRAERLLRAERHEPGGGGRERRSGAAD